MNKETLQEYNTRLSENNTSLDDILTTINNLPEGGSSGGSSLDIYSTEEVKTNKVWIDGKPIYSKVIVIETLSKGVDLLISHNIENSDAIWINESASFLSNVNEALGVNWFFSTSDWVRTWINKDNGSIRMKSPSNLSTLSAYITVEYTKTTD